MLDENAAVETCEGSRKKAAALSHAGVSYAVLPRTPEYLSESGSALAGELAMQCALPLAAVPPHGPVL